MRRTTRRALAIAVAVAVVAVACGDDDGGSSALRPDPSAPIEGDVVVLAAASLTEAFGALADAFMAVNPGVDVSTSFAASSRLVTQIVEGAPADVFASADLANMERLLDAGLGGQTPVQFATNRPEIVVAPGNPLGITSVADLADDDLVVVTCAAEVPCGAYASTIFEHAGVQVTPDSYEENVKAVVTKVALGEADAGIAYATDVLASHGDVDGVEIPDDVNVVAQYPMVVTAESTNPTAAAAFVEFVLGPDGQDLLGRYGFTAP